MDVIFHAETIHIAQGVVDVGNSLIDVRLRVRASHHSVVAQPERGIGIRDLSAWNQILSVRQLGLEQLGRYWINLAGRDGGAVGAVNGIDDTLRAAIVGEGERHGGRAGGQGSVRDAHALIGEEVEQFVLLDGAAERCAELIAIQERHLLGNDGRGVVKERRGVHDAVLKLLVDLAVQFVGARLGQNINVRPAVGALRGIVHRGVDGNFLDGLRRRSGQGLADCVVHRGAGLNFAVGADETFAGIEDEAVFADLLVEFPLNKLLAPMPFTEKLLLVSRCPLAKMA